MESVATCKVKDEKGLPNTVCEEMSKYLTDSHVVYDFATDPF